MITLIYGKENLVKDQHTCHYEFEAEPKVHIFFRRVVQSSQVETVTEMAQSV